MLRLLQYNAIVVLESLFATVKWLGHTSAVSTRIEGSKPLCAEGFHRNLLVLQDFILQSPFNIM